MDIIRVSDTKVLYDGRTWNKPTLKRSGGRVPSPYYFACIKKNGLERNISLHKYIWEQSHGRIPDGYDIHHVDNNPENNSLENLVMMATNEHRRMHQLQKVGLNIEDFKGVCVVCGKPIPDSKPWAIYDSKACKQRMARRLGRYKEEATCALCGKPFWRNKYKPTEVCSECTQEKLKQDVENGVYGVEKICPVCGKTFRTIHNAQCHPECLSKYKWMRLKEREQKQEVRYCKLCGKELTPAQSAFCCMEHSNKWQHEQSEKRELDINAQHVLQGKGSTRNRVAC